MRRCLRARRQELHGRVADVMTTSLASVVEHRPEMLAHHLTGAGRVPEAIAAWERAARQAFSTSALAESEAHVRTALGLDRPARTRARTRSASRWASRSSWAGSRRRRTAWLHRSSGSPTPARSISAGRSKTGRGSSRCSSAPGARRSRTATSAGRCGTWTRSYASGMPHRIRGCSAGCATPRPRRRFAQGDMPRADVLLDEIFGAGATSGEAIEFGLDITTVALTHRLLVDWHLGRIDDARRHRRAVPDRGGVRVGVGARDDADGLLLPVHPDARPRADRAPRRAASGPRDRSRPADVGGLGRPLPRMGARGPRRHRRGDRVDAPRPGRIPRDGPAHRSSRVPPVDRDRAVRGG